MRGLSFKSNIALEQGGAIFIRDLNEKRPNVVIEQTKFEHNRAIQGLGGDIFAQNTKSNAKGKTTILQMKGVQINNAVENQNSMHLTGIVVSANNISVDSKSHI